MKKGRLYILLLAIVAAAVLVVAFHREREPAEPEFGGKKLSEWVDLVGLAGFTREQAAQDPFGHMGTNALPYLVRWLRYEPPPWKRKLYETVNTILGPDREPRRWRPRDKQRLREFGASVALQILGAKAVAAVPELCQVLNDPTSHFSAWAAATALPHLGKEGLRAAVMGLTNHEDWVRHSVSHDLAWLGTNARPALPGLLDLLEHPDSNTRRIATNALLDIDPQALERGLDQIDPKAMERATQ